MQIFSNIIEWTIGDGCVFALTGKAVFISIISLVIYGLLMSHGLGDAMEFGQ